MATVFIFHAIHCPQRRLAEIPLGVSVMDHGLWPWGNAKPRREYAAFLFSTPFRGETKPRPMAVAVYSTSTLFIPEIAFESIIRVVRLCEHVLPEDFHFRGRAFGGRSFTDAH
jgi:hypothetical protein